MTITALVTRQFSLLKLVT